MKKLMMLAVVASWAIGTPAPAADEFLPSDIHSIKLWLDAGNTNSLTIMGSRVALWQDISTNKYRAIQNAHAFRPVYVKDAYNNPPVARQGARFATNTAGIVKTHPVLPMVRFFGNSQYFGSFMRTHCVPATGGDPRTLVVALANVGHFTFKSNHVLHYGSPSPMAAYGIATRLGARNYWGNHYWQGAFDTGVPSQEPDGVILVMSYGDGIDKFTSNGGMTISYQVDLNTAGGTGDKYGIFIGARIFPANGKGTESGCFDVAEILAFSSALTVEDRQKVEGYLAHKWDIADKLPSNHPYKTARPTSSPAQTAQN
ncbi:MAG: hypothetical protein WCL44_04950 [bacterium]